MKTFQAAFFSIVFLWTFTSSCDNQKQIQNCHNQVYIDGMLLNCQNVYESKEKESIVCVKCSGFVDTVYLPLYAKRKLVCKS